MSKYHFNKAAIKMTNHLRIQQQVKGNPCFDPVNNHIYITGERSNWGMRTFEKIQPLEVNAT